MNTAEYYIEHLNLLPHPEGGYYKETYRAETEIKTGAENEIRSVCTSIYFLLKDTEISHLHRIKSDEQWYFHAGNTLEIIVIHEGVLSIYELGDIIENGGSLHLIVPSGAWFGSRIKNKLGFALVSCVLAPGFDFVDFELAEYKKISQDFPAYNSLLKEMCIK